MSDLSELFETDPLKYTDPNIDRIVARMRESKTQFDLGIKPAAPPKPAKSAKTQDLLKDLGLA